MVTVLCLIAVVSRFIDTEINFSLGYLHNSCPHQLLPNEQIVFSFNWFLKEKNKRGGRLGEIFF